MLGLERCGHRHKKYRMHSGRIKIQARSRGITIAFVLWGWIAYPLVWAIFVFNDEQLTGWVWWFCYRLPIEHGEARFSYQQLLAIFQQIAASFRPKHGNRAGISTNNRSEELTMQLVLNWVSSNASTMQSPYENFSWIWSLMSNETSVSKSCPHSSSWNTGW